LWILLNKVSLQIFKSMTAQPNTAVQIWFNQIRQAVEDGQKKNINDLFKVYITLAKTGEKFKNLLVHVLQSRLGVMRKNIFSDSIKKKIFILTKNCTRLKYWKLIKTKGWGKYPKNINLSPKILPKSLREVTLKLLIISRGSKKNIMRR